MGNCLGGGGGGGGGGGTRGGGTSGGGGGGGAPGGGGGGPSNLLNATGNRSGVAPTVAATGGGPPDFGLAGAYEVLHLLGTGGEGETWLCRERASGRELAVKLVARPIPKSITQIIQREIKILADLGDGHLNIVHAEEVVLTPTHVGLVMEYVRGGNMVSFVTSRRETRDARGGLCIPEDEAAFFFRQLVWAVRFCHASHVAHRDLKLDNTLLDGRDPPRLKLCDFGFAKSWGGAGPTMDTMRIGTPEYMAPDLISGRSGYDGKKVDVWASGVLLFVMLLGMFPFEMEDDNYVNTAGLYSIWIQQIRTGWQVREGAVDFVCFLFFRSFGFCLCVVVCRLRACAFIARAHCASLPLAAPGSTARHGASLFVLTPPAAQTTKHEPQTTNVTKNKKTPQPAGGAGQRGRGGAPQPRVPRPARPHVRRQPGDAHRRRGDRRAPLVRPPLARQVRGGARDPAARANRGGPAAGGGGAGRRRPRARARRRAARPAGQGHAPAGPW